MKIKVLPLPTYFRNITVSRIRKEFRLEEIPPVFKRNGWYYDREKKTAWYECLGRGWTDRMTTEMFIHVFKTVSARHFEPAEISAIQTLLVYGGCPKELLEELHYFRHRMELRNTRREGKMAVRRILNS